MSLLSHPPIVSSELGNLWMSYQKKTLMSRVLEHFMHHSHDEEALAIMKPLYRTSEEAVERITGLLQEAGAVKPVGFTAEDVCPQAPRIFDEIFELMYLRTMCKIGSGLYTLFCTMSYRSDVVDLFRHLTSQSQATYAKLTDLLLAKGLLPRPPYMTMPKEVEFIQDKSYMSGFNIFSDERALNTIEVGQIYQAIESNMAGIQMMTGFAQSAKDPEVKDYFLRGVELAKKIVTDLGDDLKQSGIQPPATWAGKATVATEGPFSDKLMMYNTNLMSTFSFGSNAIGGAFSLRSDLPLKMMMILKDIFDFAKDGGKLMIKHHWMEEPPQTENRNELVKT